jgi:hypothetical protein
VNGVRSSPVVATLAIGAVLLSACTGRNAVTRTGEPAMTTGTPVAFGTLIASGDSWDLFVEEGDGLCFTVVGPSGDNRPCFIWEPPGPLGTANVESLGSEGALFYGRVSTRIATIQVRFDDGSVAEAADIIHPPATIEEEINLFVLELDGPEGSAIARLLDERGKELATAKFTWAEGTSIGFTLPRRPPP